MDDIQPLVARTEAAFGQPARYIEVEWPNRDNALIRITTAKEAAITDRRRGGNPSLSFEGTSGRLLKTDPAPAPTTASPRAPTTCS